MANYTTTVGRVISAKVGMGRRNESSPVTQTSSLKKVYYPDITYEYTVNDQTYQNNQFWKEEKKLNLLTRVGTLVSQYPIGGKATIHYNPHNPSDSYLKESPDAGNRRAKLVLFAAGAVVLLGIAVFVMMSLPA